MKKEWKKPQLFVISRGHVEENVLTACKSDSVSGSPAIKQDFILSKVACFVFCQRFSALRIHGSQHRERRNALLP
jgi:hypothetical protein